MPVDIRVEIAEKRLADIAVEGAAQGISLPANRLFPIVPFLQGPGVICEVKRCSPSVKNINNNLDPVVLARSYAVSGVRSISVLTEQNYFRGSLTDLIKIKTALPDVAILRKDFLLTEEDVEVSCRAGADAFLLIASLLDDKKLEAMYRLGCKLGMTPVVELHSLEDVMKAVDLKPDHVGINSRDLRIFKIKPTQPLIIRSMINWDCRIIYESGIKTGYDIDFVKGTGFDAVLVGEAAVRNQEFAEKLVNVFSPVTAGDGVSDRFTFWKRLYSRYNPGRPLVKICGITNHADLERIIDLGADIAGFILADSPRKVDLSFIESCRDYKILKVGVVVLKQGQPLPSEVAGLISSGALDAVQFHGDELPQEYTKWPGYKAVRIRAAEDADAAGGLSGPAILIDAFSPEAHGGTGKKIDPGLVRAVSAQQTLWLAGGITPENVHEIITAFEPELIDISSGVEESPGKKDNERLIKLFEEING